MPYDFNIYGRMSLETRQAYQAGLQLNQDLNRLMSETSIKLNTDNLVSANKQVLELQSNLRAALNPTRGTIDLAMLSQQLDRSGTSLTQYAANLNKYGKDGQQAFISLTKQIAAAEAPTTRLSQRVKDAGEQLKRTIGWQVSSSAIHGVISTYNQAIGYAKELNRSLTDIRIVTGQSNVQMANFAKYANSAAKSLSSTTTRYTDAALIYYQQGLSDKAVKERANVTVKMANVAGVSAEKASQQLTAIWNNFDNGTKSLEHYADVLVKLGSETASSSDEISKGIQKFAAIGNTVGLSYEYAASALATVTATTRESADTVGTSFRTLFGRLQGLSLGQTLEDGTTLNKYSKALDTIGVRIKETNGEMKAMDTILDEIGAKWKTLSKDTQIGLAQSIGGTRQYASFMALMDNWDYFQENVNRANNAAGTLQKQQDIYAESWAAASKQVQASMEGIFDAVINDQFVIKATKGFAVVLDSVKGLTQGFGNLDGMMTTVLRVGLNKYAKEFPRMLEDAKYNVGYMFNSKTGTVDKRQQSIFSQAYEGLNNLAGQNKMRASLDLNDKGQTVGIKWDENTLGTDIVLGTELKNAALALDRRQQYLMAEKSLSEREKQQYQQAMQTAAMWDSLAISQAQQVKDASESLSSVRKDIAKENYDNLTDTSGKYSKRYRVNENGKTVVNQYDLRKDDERNAYFDVRAQDLKKRRAAEEQAIRQNSEYWTDKKSTSQKPALTAEGKALIKSINKSYEDRLVGLQTEKSNIVDQIRGSIIQDLDINSKYVQSAFTKIGSDGKNYFDQSAVDNFNAVLKEVNAGNKITTTQRQILQEGFEAMQKPLVDATGSFGKLSYHTDKLTNNIDKNNTAIMSATTVQEKFKDTSGNISKTWSEFTQNASKAGVLISKDESGKKIISTEYREAKQAYSNLQKALSGSASEAEIYRLTKEFEAKTTAITDKVERVSWERGLTDDQTAAIRQRAEQNKRSIEAQKEIEFKQQQQQNLQIQHQQQTVEKLAQTGQALMSVYSAYRGMQGAWNTLSDENASSADKFGAILGASANTALLANQAAKSKTLVTAGSKLGTWFVGTKAGGAVTGALAAGATKAGAAATAAGATKIGGALAAGGAKLAGAAAGSAAIPGVGWAVAAVIGAIALAPKLMEVTDKAIETSKEREQRLAKEYTTLEQIAQTSKEKQALYEQSRSSYLNSVEKFYNTEQGNIENLKALSEANEQAMSLIKDGNLSYEDYKINDNGLIQIDYTALKNTEEQLARQTAEAQAKYSISNTTQLLRDRKTDFDYYGFIGETRLKNLQQQIDSGKTLSKRQQEKYNELFEISTKKQLDDNKIITSFNQSLLAAAQSDGSFTKEDKAAIASLTSSMSADQLQSIQKQLDLKFDTKKPLWESEWSIKNNAINQNIMTKDQMESLINSQEYKDLKSQDKGQAQQYLLDAVKNQAYLNEYNKLIDKAKKQEKELNAEYRRQSINDFNMGDLKDLVKSQSGKLYNAETFGDKEYKFVLAQYNKVATDFYKAIGEYLPDTTFTGALEQFTLYEAEVLSETLQDFGEIFGDDAAKSIYNATLNASKEDREALLANLKSIDFSGSALQSLDQIYELSEDFGGQYTKLFEDIRQSFGGDAGIFKTLTGDKTIQKLVNNFENFGDIDAESIMKASHSSSDLALALELANFNAGGLAAALEGVASGAINEKQVSNSLLAGLSTLNQIDTARGYAFDSVDNYDKGRAVTDLTKFTGNLAKTIRYNLRNGLMFDEPLMNAWGELFGENKKNELKQDFINWGSVDKKDISKSFNEKYKTEKKLIQAMQKNPYDFNALWEYALDSSQIKLNERENDEWVHAGDKKEDTDERSYNTISEEEWATFQQYATKGEDGQWTVNEGVTGIAKEFADTIAVKINKENEYKDKYVNIDGAVYKIGQGERDVHWDDEQKKWLGYKDKEVNTSNALFGYDPRKKGVIFNDYFAQQNMDYKELKNIMQLNLGMSENTADRMIAEAAAQNTDVQKTLDQNGIDNVIRDMIIAANENDEYITSDQMDIIFQNSEYLQNKYQGSGTKGWMLDFLNEDNIEVSKDEDPIKYAAEVEKRRRFKEKYVDFSGAKSNSYEDMNNALEKNTGYSIEDRIKKNGKTVNTAIYGEKTNFWTGEKTTDYSDIKGYEEKTGFDLSDNLNQLLAMGLSEEAAYDALTKTMQETGNVLIESIRGVDGSIQTFSSDSAKFQHWSQEHGIDSEEATAESFSKFISEEDAVAKAVQQMAIEAKAKTEYEKTYNADGSLKTPEEIAKDAGKTKGDVATDENGNPLIDTDNNGEPDKTATEAEKPVQQPASGGEGGGGDDSGSTSSGSGGNKSSSSNLIVNAIKAGTIKYDEKTNSFYNPNTSYTPGSGMTGSEWRDKQQTSQALVDAANELKSINAGLAALKGKAIGQNQYKITKKYASGRKNTDNYEGLAQVGEEGPELSVDKDGNTTIL